MRQADASAGTPKFLMLGSICVVVAALYFAQEVLIPLALAALLSFLLAPLVKRLEHLRLPRSAAVVVTVLFSFGVLFGFGWVVFNQLSELKADIGTYHEHVVQKLHSMQKKGGILNLVHSAGAEVNQVMNAPTSEPAETAQAHSVTPVVDAPVNQSSPFDLLKPIGSFLLGPVGTAFVVTVFTIFMLLQREDLRDRLIRLVGRNRLTLTTRALDDAADRVSRYLLMQSIINGGVGVVILILLWGIGELNGITFPAVALWGMMTALLRFIPYIGVWVSAILPLLLSIAVYPGAKAAIETLASYMGVELIAANAIEPLLLGSSTGIATLAVLVAAAFWTWLWGPVGLLLSTPLTVCLVVMGKYVPQLEFLTILLAEEPALSPPDRVYQRLLALDQEEAEDLVDECAKKMSLEDVYDTILVPHPGDR
jgi:predicted PurR-regulated permease PerM